MHTNKKDSISTTVIPQFGVALSGGGARGFAHAGALKAIEEAGIRPGIIAGVSAGAVVAVLYAAGVRPDNILRLFSERGFTDFASFQFGGGGLFRADKFKNLILRAIGGDRNLEDLNIPTYIGVTDLDHGIPCEFHTGPVGDRMMASCSIPIIFKPVCIDGTYYVDGGVLRNHPAWTIRDKCKTLIGVNVSPMNLDGSKADTLTGVAMRTYNMMLKSNQAADMSLCDISVQTPEISHYSTFNLKMINNVFTSGYIHMRRALRDAGLWNPVPDGKFKE
ncbi:MAG: patatin-like phospholipase family protein [Muribaculaceae bacterium]|nr:patatin-like phospholipase family protein [Muribaculaceae bacterium]